MEHHQIIHPGDERHEQSNAKPPHAQHLQTTIVPPIVSDGQEMALRLEKFCPNRKLPPLPSGPKSLSANDRMDLAASVEHSAYPRWHDSQKMHVQQTAPTASNKERPYRIMEQNAEAICSRKLMNRKTASNDTSNAKCSRAFRARQKEKETTRLRDIATLKLHLKEMTEARDHYYSSLIEMEKERNFYRSKVRDLEVFQ